MQQNDLSAFSTRKHPVQLSNIIGNDAAVNVRSTLQENQEKPNSIEIY